MKDLGRLLLIAALVCCLPAVAGAAKPGPGGDKHTRINAEVTKLLRKKGFPNMTRCEVLAPPTGHKKGSYNCISHSLKVYHRWAWPGKRLADFDELYGSLGYHRSSKLDYHFEKHLEKIVVYGKRGKDGRLECTHAARQLTDGTWTSKIGAGPLIRHAAPDSVDGPSYGRPVAVYVRHRHVPVVGTR